MLAFDIIGDAHPTEFGFRQSWIDHTTPVIARLQCRVVPTELTGSY
jgi:hypothetical protein